MEHFYNSNGVATSPATSGSKLSSIGGAIGGQIAGAIVSGLFAKGENEKALALQEELGKLSLAQQKQLEERLQDVRSETERQGLLYQFLAVQKNNEMLNRIQSKRYTSYIVLGVGATILALVFLKLAKR